MADSDSMTSSAEAATDADSEVVPDEHAVRARAVTASGTRMRVTARVGFMHP
jgi:hypothetical protein